MAQHNEPVTPYLLFCVVVGTLTAFSFGYHSGVINQPRDAMTRCEPNPAEYLPTCIPMDDWQWGTFVSMFLFGGVFGGLTGGHFATQLGRRRTLFYNNAGFILGGLCLSQGATAEVLFLGRFIVGVSAGIGTVALPVYISEISPVSKRGVLGTLNQIGIVVGILVSVLVGIPLATKDGWRTMLTLSLAGPVLQACLLPLCVETPRWLSSNSLLLDAKEALQKLRGQDDPAVPDESTAGMLDGVSVESVEDLDASSSTTAVAPEEVKRDHEIRPVGLWEAMNSPELRRCFMAALGLHAAQQFSGINAAIFYSTTIFQQSYSPETAIKLTVLISLVNLFMTIVLGTLIERLGRKTLLLVSQMGMCACALGTLMSVRLNANPGVIVVLLVAFVGMFAVGLGAVPWLILPELVPPYAVGPAASLGTGINWFSAFLIALLFPSAIALLGYDIFLVFATILIGSIMFTYRMVPETKGRSAEEIARAFARQVE